MVEQPVKLMDMFEELERQVNPPAVVNMDDGTFKLMPINYEAIHKLTTSDLFLAAHRLIKRGLRCEKQLKEAL